MLYAKFVRAYTHTLRLHMMCTLFLVYTYVIHSYIALYVHYCMIAYFPFYFQIFLLYIQTIHTAYEHCISLEFHWNMTYWYMLPGYSTFHQVYIRYILHIMEIPKSLD